MVDETASTPVYGVIYSDGSCNAINPYEAASRGHAGWGMHGYLFTKEPPKVGAGAKKGIPTAKGYDLKGSGKGDITVVKYVDGFGSIIGEATNNVAELTAAIQALEIAVQQKLAGILIRSDSKYVVDGHGWLEKWRKNQYRKVDGTEIGNVKLWKRLDELLTILDEFGTKVEFVWVKAHNGANADPGNVIADRYARRGTLSNREKKPIFEVVVSEAKGYWKPQHEHHRMLSLANWYLTTSGEMDEVSPDGRKIYYLGDIRTGEEFLGKRIANASFAVVYLKQGEPMLDQLREHFRDLSKGTMQGLIVSHLNSVFSAHVYDALITYGEKLLVLNRQRQAIEHMDKAKDEDKEGIELGHEIRPTRLAYSAVQVLDNLEGLLNDYITPKPTSRARTSDITSLLYERTESAKKVTVKLKGDLPPGAKSVDVPVTFSSGGEDKSKTVRLTLGQDIPDRNTLAALADEGLKVSVITWPESPQAFRYATIIESSEDIGIWAGPYANLQLLM
jgi:ribonuclease HI